MEILDRLKEMTRQNDADLWGEWCAKAALMSLRAIWESQRQNQPSNAWLARQCILARKGWVVLGDSSVGFKATGATFEIVSSMNLRSAVHLIITVEYAYELRQRGLTADQLDSLISLCHSSADRFLDRQLGST